MKKRTRFFWEDPFEEMQKTMKGIFGERMAVNLSETDKEIVVRANVPGFKKDKIELDVTEDSIDIRAKKSKEEREEKENYFRREFAKSGYHRAFTLPEKVKPENTEASLSDGILTIKMPKVKVDKKKKSKIEIK